LQVEKTKAAILVETKNPLTVADIRLPKELTCGQVLVKVHYSGICGAQINEIEAAKGPDKFLPHLLGHEGAATVMEVGPGVKTVKVGDRVCMHWRPSDGIQSDTPSYDWEGRKVNAGWVTTFNQHAVVSENRLTPVSEDIDMKLLPLFGCAVTTAVGVINNDAKLRIGQSLVVLGIGGVGLNIVQFASMVSAFPIIGVDIVDAKLDMGMRFGATKCFNAAKEKELESRILALVGSQGADVVVDTTGDARIIEQAYRLTHADGTTVLVGVPKKGDNVSIYTLPLHFNKVLTGSHGGDAVPHKDIPRLIRLWRADKLTLDGLITHCFKLNQINEALDVVKSGDAGRVLIEMD
jgi:S-(hydroxymethyl)glutathione dehydrogenase / alcohol dehydrogenase